MRTDIHLRAAGNHRVLIVDQIVCADQNPAIAFKVTTIDFVVVDNLIARTQLGQVAIYRAVIQDRVIGTQLSVRRFDRRIGLIGDVLTRQAQGIA